MPNVIVRSLSLALLLCIVSAAGALAQDAVTPQEVVDKVVAAREHLKAAGEAGLAEISQAGGPWAWKDTYVQAYDCPGDKIAAHPNPKLVGLQLSSVMDKRGNYISMDICDASEKPGGGWTEYWWPKVGSETPERKVTFALKVDGTPYVVSAGIYSNDLTLDALKELTAK